MGFNWAKFQLPWKDFEGQRGQRNWPDDIIGDLNGNGLNILVSIVKAPDWARPGIRTTASKVRPPIRHVCVVCRRFAALLRSCAGDRGVERTEPRLRVGPEPLDPARYVRLLAAAYGAINRACPSTVVVSGALTPTGAAATGSDGRLHLPGAHVSSRSEEYADAIGAHPSGFNVAPDVAGGRLPVTSYAARVRFTWPSQFSAPFVELPFDDGGLPQHHAQVR